MTAPDEREDADSSPPADDPDEDEEFTPQSESFRQQQYVVGIGGAILAGFALAVSSVQHFPDLPTAIPLVAGLVGGGFVYWIVSRSLFPTEEELPVE